MKKYKLGVFVYPIGEDFPNGKKQIKLFSKGIFFTDPEKGWEYEEKMNKTDTEHSCWCASLIRYDTDKLYKKPKEVVDRFVLTIESTTETDI